MKDLNLFLITGLPLLAGFFTLLFKEKKQRANLALIVFLLIILSSL
jgi:hypothetical protein